MKLFQINPLKIKHLYTWCHFQISEFPFSQKKKKQIKFIVQLKYLVKHTTSQMECLQTSDFIHRKFQ